MCENPLHPSFYRFFSHEHSQRFPYRSNICINNDHGDSSADDNTITTTATALLLELVIL